MSAGEQQHAGSAQSRRYGLLVRHDKRGARGVQHDDVERLPARNVQHTAKFNDRTNVHNHRSMQRAYVESYKQQVCRYYYTYLI